MILLLSKSRELLLYACAGTRTGELVGNILGGIRYFT